MSVAGLRLLDTRGGPGMNGHCSGYHLPYLSQEEGSTSRVLQRTVICQMHSPPRSPKHPPEKRIPRSYLVGGPRLLVSPVPVAAQVPPLNLQ